VVGAQTGALRRHRRQKRRPDRDSERAENFRRDAATELWILGSGQVPKKVRGELVFPDLVVGKEPEKFPEGVVVIRPMPVNASIGTQPGRII